MDIEPYKTKYKVLVSATNGEAINITQAITDFTPEEQPDELAERVNVVVANVPHGSGTISDVIKPGCGLFIFADWGEGMQETFRGVVWDWDDENSSDAKSLEFSAYDILIYTEKSKDNRYYSAGMSTQAIISDIASSWGIPLNFKYPSITHAKQAFKSQALSDMFKTVMDDAQSKMTGDYVILAKEGAMHVLPKGSNTKMCVFESGKNTEVVSNKLSMDDLITKVIVIGKEDSEGRSPLEAVLEGDTKYGTLQDIVDRDEDTSLDDAVSQAKDMLQKQGSLKEDRSINVPDVPFLRKGDRVKVAAGSINGYFYVTGVTHTPTERRMTLQLETTTKPTVPITGGPVSSTSSSSESSEFNIGDAVILNGAVYATSYGEGKGRTFSNWHGTIKRKVDLSRACPYHVDWLGWVYPSEIKHA